VLRDDELDELGAGAGVGAGAGAGVVLVLRWLADDDDELLGAGVADGREVDERVALLLGVALGAGVADERVADERDGCCVVLVELRVVALR
jgi:hypothetical protein